MQTGNDKADCLFRQVDAAEKAIGAGKLEKAGLMMYQAVETAMIGSAKVRNLPHEEYDDLLRLAGQLDKERGTPHSHTVPLLAARAMYDNSHLHFLDVEKTLMSPDSARKFILALQEFHAAA